MRSPAEHYIRYCLIRDLAKPTDDIARDLQAELVFGPGKGYFQKLRDEMIVPKVFRPDSLTDKVSSDFLKRWGVWSMWHPHRGTREALSIFSKPRQRSLLQMLVSGPQPDSIIIETFIRKAKAPLSDDGLDEFRHYFWNVALLSAEELGEYVSAFMPTHRTLSQVIKAPGDEMGHLYVGVKLGILPNFMDDAEIVHLYKRIMLADLIELKAEQRAGIDRGSAIASSASTMERLINLEERLKIQRREDLDDLSEYRVAERRFDNPERRVIGQGAVPVPVGLLIAHEADKEAEG